MKKIVVAIDGYSSCGKSTLAKQLAKELGYLYVDTGAMYRAVAYYANQNGFFDDNILNISKLVESLSKINITFSFNTDLNLSETCLNGQNVEKFIRTIDISNKVSKIAQIREVRDKMVELQSKMGLEKGLVMDGRDIGTVVFPNAELKLFMTASPEIRAKRRFDELIQNGEKVNFKEVFANIALRDNDDTSRAEHPLIKAFDAVVIDNSDLSQKEQFSFVLDLCKNKINQ